MAEETKNPAPTVPEAPAAPSSEEYIRTIQELSMRPTQEEYDALKKENGQLVHALAKGETLPGSAPAAPEKSSDEYAKDLMKPGLSNLEYVTLSLKQRSKAIEEGKPDPYMPQGKSFTQGTKDDAEDAKSAAEFLQSCVDEANGNSAAFTALLQARLKDDPQVAIAIQARKAAQEKSAKRKR